MRLHPRERVVSKASLKMRERIFEATKGCETYEEYLVPLLQVKKKILLKKLLPYSGELEATPEHWGLSSVIHILVRKTIAEYELTAVEAYQILTSFELLESKYMLRLERHGDENKEAGLLHDD